MSTALDFTLRDVALRPGDEEPPVCDLVFHNGRLSAKRPLADERRPRLFAHPGFWDAHVHMLHLGLRRQRCDLGGARSLDEALAIVAAYASAHPEKTALWVEDFDETAWPEARVPTGAEIDRVVSDRPCIWRRVCGHLAILNSRAAAEAAGRWSDLDPRGIVTEERAMALASVWPPTPQEREQALLDAQERALPLGIVRVSEMGSEGALDAYLGLVKRGTLRGEVRLYVRPGLLDAALRLRDEGWLGGGSLQLGGVKVFADGSIGARTAALRAPYADDPGRGRLLCSDAALQETFTRCLRAGVSCAVHAIGDAAIEQAIAQAERAAAAHGDVPRGWASLEHAEMIDGPQLERAGRARLGISMQPNFVARWGGPGGLYERALGAERWERLNPFRRAWDSGVPLVFGSDGMPMDPSVGLRGAVGHPLAASRLSAAEALTVYAGGRETGAREWQPDPPWQLGTDGLVLFERDPARAAEEKGAPLEACAVLRRGRWVVPPAETLRRSGVFHAA